jgi:glutamate synthase domain-containing protein 2
MAMHAELPGDLSAEKAIYNYIKAIGKGLSKIMSKMGVSTYMSYCGAQLFEAIGLSKDLVTSTSAAPPPRWKASACSRWPRRPPQPPRAFGTDPVLAAMLDAGGEYAWRARGEEHMWTPDAIAKLQHSTRSGKFDTYKEYAQIINDQSKRHLTLRGLFEFKFDPAKAIPLDEVEPAGDRQALRHRRHVAGLHLHRGPQHPGLAMNRIGGKSNTGEGGEDPARYRNELKGIPITAGTTGGRRRARKSSRPTTS